VLGRSRRKFMRMTDAVVKREGAVSMELHVCWSS
jgi:hypothetical protein